MLPARQTIYDVAGESYPVYNRLYELVMDEQNRIFRFGPDVYTYLTDAYFNYDELMEIIKECQKVAVRAGAESVSAYVKITYRPEGEVLTIEKKVTKHHK